MADAGGSDADADLTDQAELDEVLDDDPAAPAGDEDSIVVAEALTASEAQSPAAPPAPLPDVPPQPDGPQRRR